MPRGTRQSTSDFRQKVVNVVTEELRMAPPTARQVYYRLVAAGVVGNSQNSYQKVVTTLRWLRMNNVIGFGDICDRGRDVMAGSIDCFNADPRQAILGYLSYLRNSEYAINVSRWFGQPVLVSVFVEKAALLGHLETACKPLGVPHMACRGYPSVSALYDWVKMMAPYMAGTGTGEQTWRPEKCVLLYLGDHDPDGVQIPRSITSSTAQVMKACFNDSRRDNAEEFVFPVEVHRIALTHAQINRYNPPPFPAKPSSSRFASYVERTGIDDAWELDALPTKAMLQLIKDKVNEHFDDDIHRRNEAFVSRIRSRVRVVAEEVYQAGLAALPPVESSRWDIPSQPDFEDIGVAFDSDRVLSFRDEYGSFEVNPVEVDTDNDEEDYDYE